MYLKFKNFLLYRPTRPTRPPASSELRPSPLGSRWIPKGDCKVTVLFFFPVEKVCQPVKIFGFTSVKTWHYP